MPTKRDQLESLSHSFLQRFVSHADLARSQCSYRTYDDYVSKLEARLTSEECAFLKGAASNASAQAVADEFLRQYRPNENILRNEFETYLDEQDTSNPREREFPIGDNRCDIVEVGDQIVAYELKSPQDRRSRLSAQLETYEAVFDKVWVVLPDDETSFGQIPTTVGEIRYRYFPFEFEVIREPITTPTTRPHAQLGSLRVEELQAICEYNGLSGKIRKPGLMSNIESNLSTDEVHRAFTRALQNRVKGKSTKLTTFVES